MAGDVRHSMRHSSENTIWRTMVQRCHNPKNSMYSYYGGRGILVCQRWRDAFMNFYSDMGPRPSMKHTIDRIDNNGPYSLENCRWASKNEQQWNRRDSRLIGFRGQLKPMTAWAEELGMYYSTLYKRIVLNKWPVERALTEPPQNASRKMSDKEMTKSP